MKKLFNLNIRVAAEEWQAFRAACETLDVTASSVIRDLCRTSVPYMQDKCKDGRWRPPILITERQAGQIDMRADIIQVHNGNGHQITKSDKTRKVRHK